MRRYVYEIYTAFNEGQAIVDRKLWTTATSLAEVGLLVNRTPGQVSYLLNDKLGSVWHGIAVGGHGLFQVVRKRNKA